MSHHNHIPDKAFILAAGLGTRMRPLTDQIPKPLLKIGGKSLLEHSLDQLEHIGVHDVIINTHYLGHKIPEQIKPRRKLKLHFSYEEELLDTGGGIKKNLPFFQGEPFYVLSGDGLWSNPPKENTLKALAQIWNPDKMDILLLLQPVNSMTLTHPVGDYNFTQDGRVERSQSQDGTHMFTSIRINHPRIFDHAPTGAFSYLELMDKAEREGRLYGLSHKGEWHHLSTPKDLKHVQQALDKKEIHIS